MAGWFQRPLPVLLGERVGFGQGVEATFCSGELAFKLVESLLLFISRRGHPGRRIAVVARAPVFGNVVEVGRELIVLTLCERIEFVIVAARAAEREAEKDGGRRV